jgi:hypothetical protein
MRSGTRVSTMHLQAANGSRLLLLLVSSLLLGTTSALAQAPQTQPPPELGPSNNAELGLVVATGNAEAATVGLRNVYVYRWPNAEFGWEAGWVGASSPEGDRFAVQHVTGSGFDVIEPDTAVDSNRLFSKLRYQRQFRVRHDWFVNSDAVRDTPSNINRQFVLAGGLGTTWEKTDRVTFRTSYGISSTYEDLEVEGTNRFAGYRLGYALKTAIAAASTFDSELTTDGSFDASDDIRADLLNGISVAINSRLALKTSFRMLFRNLPALEALDLRTPAGVVVGTVDVPKKEVDTTLTTSLVMTF